MSFLTTTVFPVIRRWCLLLVSLLATTAFAERRFALIVGANEGWATDRALRYAHDDARRMQDVLVQMGSFAPADTVLLLDPNTKDVLAALEKVEAKLAATKETTFFYFYYSGHADSAALHLRGPVLNLGTLADRLGLEPVVDIVDPRRAAPDRQITNPVSYSKTPATYRSAPPGVGEDNEAVLAWLRTGAR